MPSYEVSTELAHPQSFGDFAPPAEVPYPSDGIASLDEAGLRAYAGAVAEEARAGAAWLRGLEDDEDVAIVAALDASNRNQVVSFEHFLGADSATAHNVHGAFDEGYGNYWKYVAKAHGETAQTDVPAPVRLFRLPKTADAPNGRLLLTLSYTPPTPTPEDTLHALRESLRAPMDNTFWERVVNGAASTSPGEAEGDAADFTDDPAAIDAVLDNFPGLDAAEHGRGTGMTMIYSDINGIARTMDAAGNLGLCHWYLIREGSDTSVEKQAAAYHGAGNAA